MRPGSHTTLLEGVPLAYHVTGTGPVVLVHPGGPGSTWSYLRMRELEARATVVYIEPVGTGASGRLPDPSAYTLETYVKGVEAVRAALGLGRVTLLGHSHGGWVAQAYALAHPDRLRALVLYATTPTSGADWGADVAARMASFAVEPWYAEAMVEQPLPTTDAEASANWRRLAPFYFFDWTTRHAELAPLVREASVSIAPGMAFDAAPPFDFRPRLASVTAPTLILVGARDFVCSPRWSEELHAGIAGSSLVRLEASGHMPHVEEPETFARAVGDFVTEHAAAP